MYGDPGQPGGEAGAGGELLEVFVSADVGVLHDVLRLCVAVQDGASDAVETPVVTAHDDSIKCSLSATDAAYNLFVSQVFWFGFR
jgi:hypothetical protein